MTRDEHRILQDMKSESYMNKTLEEIQSYCLSHGLRVAQTTNLHGNCLFESLIYHNIGENITNLRAGLAAMFYTFKDKKNFFPNIQDSLEELFIPTNEILFARGIILTKYTDPETNEEKTKYHESLCKYDYISMVQEVANQYCWDSLPTQIILMLVSFLFKVNINIIHNNGHITEINMFEGVENAPKISNIYLALIGESHYVPVDILEEGNSYQTVSYTNALIVFHKWAYEQQNLLIAEWQKKESEEQIKNITNQEKPIWDTHISQPQQTQTQCTLESTLTDIPMSTMTTLDISQLTNMIESQPTEFGNLSGNIGRNLADM